MTKKGWRILLNIAVMLMVAGFVAYMFSSVNEQLSDAVTVAKSGESFDSDIESACTLETSPYERGNEKANLPPPQYITEDAYIFAVHRQVDFTGEKYENIKSNVNNVGDPVDAPVSKSMTKIIMILTEYDVAPSEIQKKLGIKHRPTFRKNYLYPAIAFGLITPTIPDKPNSRPQKYRLTEKGKNLLSSLNKNIVGLQKKN
jgi:predicted transcriptional regulator